ncbi:MAG: hypothetical protein IT371_08015 [Deltaproteobacteria bacterium]|nr:hypothetical protein [Deltaproteobacteria bacterium]
MSTLRRSLRVGACAAVLAGAGWAAGCGDGGREEVWQAHPSQAASRPCLTGAAAEQLVHALYGAFFDRAADPGALVQRRRQLVEASRDAGSLRQTIRATVAELANSGEFRLRQTTDLGGRPLDWRYADNGAFVRAWTRVPAVAPFPWPASCGSAPRGAFPYETIPFEGPVPPSEATVRWLREIVREWVPALSPRLDFAVGSTEYWLAASAEYLLAEEAALGTPRRGEWRSDAHVRWALVATDVYDRAHPADWSRRFFIDQLYRRLLSRAPDPEGGLTLLYLYQGLSALEIPAQTIRVELAKMIYWSQEFRRHPFWSTKDWGYRRRNLVLPGGVRFEEVHPHWATVFFTQLGDGFHRAWTAFFDSGIHRDVGRTVGEAIQAMLDEIGRDRGK